MAQQAARGQQHNIEAPDMRLEIVAAGDPDAGGLFDALAQLGRDGFERGFPRAARLGLDEDQRVPFRADQVDLAGGRSDAAVENAVALELQPQRGRVFRAAGGIMLSAFFVIAGDAIT